MVHKILSKGNPFKGTILLSIKRTGLENTVVKQQMVWKPRTVDRAQIKHCGEAVNHIKYCGEAVNGFKTQNSGQGSDKTLW